MTGAGDRTLMIAVLAQELQLTCMVKRERGTCTPADCDNCRTRDLLAEAGRMLGTRYEVDIPARLAVSEEASRAEQLAQALRSVCTELRLMRGCDEGDCGTDACWYSDCVAGPALELLDRCGPEVRARD